MDSISFSMSSMRHSVERPSFTGFGKRPDFTPAHHVERETGMIAGIGGVVFLSPMICGRRKKPTLGMFARMIVSVLLLQRHPIKAE